MHMTNSIFENIKRMNEYHKEFWSARDLMAPLGYTEWRKFEGAIERAKESCKNSGQTVADHFVGADKMVSVGSQAKREVKDYHLSRYACYLIAQNGDPRKVEIANAQTYFALQTRRQEVQEQLLEDQNRVSLRNELTTRNKILSQSAKNAGVTHYANFQDFGYMGLYGGLRQKDIHIKKKLKPNEKILDHMGSEELGANIFRATQADAKIRRENIIGEHKAGEAHFEVGKKVRQTIAELGGTMPEKLPAVEDIKKAKGRLNKGDKQKVLGK